MIGLYKIEDGNCDDFVKVRDFENLEIKKSKAFGYYGYNSKVNPEKALVACNAHIIGLEDRVPTNRTYSCIYILDMKKLEIV